MKMRRPGAMMTTNMTMTTNMSTVKPEKRMLRSQFAGPATPCGSATGTRSERDDGTRCRMETTSGLLPCRMLGGETGERGAPGVDRGLAQLLLDPQQLIVLGDAL